MNEWVNVGERKGEVPGGWGTISWFLHMLIGCQHFLLQSAVRNAFCFITQYSAAYIPVKYGHVHFTYVHNFTYIKKLWNNFYTYYNLSNDLFYPSFFKKKKCWLILPDWVQVILTHYNLQSEKLEAHAWVLEWDLGWNPGSANLLPVLP